MYIYVYIWIYYWLRCRRARLLVRGSGPGRRNQSRLAEAAALLCGVGVAAPLFQPLARVQPSDRQKGRDRERCPNGNWWMAGSSGEMYDAVEKGNEGVRVQRVWGHIVKTT